MTFVEALESSYREGMGCRVRGDDSGVVYYLKTCRTASGADYVIHSASPRSNPGRHTPFREWKDTGAPAVLSALTSRYEICALPPDVEVDFRPIKETLSEVFRDQL